jgi:hypothetical protein
MKAKQSAGVWFLFSVPAVILVLSGTNCGDTETSKQTPVMIDVEDLQEIAEEALWAHPDEFMVLDDTDSPLFQLVQRLLPFDMDEEALSVVPILCAFRSLFGSDYLWSIFCGGSEYIVFPCPDRFGWSGGLDGYDVFLLADPAEAVPGKNQVHTASGSPNWKGQKGDKWILGDHNKCYYAGRERGEPDHDFLYIKVIDIENSDIVLHGSPDDYTFVDTTSHTEGAALFFKKCQGSIGWMDMVAHIKGYGSNELDLNGRLFTYAVAPDTTPVLPQGIDQTNVKTIQMYPTISSDTDGSMYLAHRSAGDYPGHVGPGGDIAVIKYDKEGAVQWTGNYGGMWPSKNGKGKKYPTLPFHHTHVNGHVFVVGFSWGKPTGQEANLCTTIVKIDAATGSQVGFRQMGTTNIEYGPNNPTSICADDAGNLYISGSWSLSRSEAAEHPNLFQAFLLKIRQDDLSTVWFNTTSYGTHMPTEGHRGVHYVPDGSGIPGQGYVYQGSFETREIDGEVATYMLGLSKWPTDGSNYLWHNVFSTPTGFGWHFMLDVDEDEFIYSAGHHQGAMSTMGDPERRYGDFYVAKHDKNGNLINIRQLGTEENDELYYMFVDEDRDCLFAVGTTYGDLFATNPNPAAPDAVLVKLDKDLNLLDGIQFGTPESDIGMGLTQSTDGFVYLTGVTEGSLVRPVDTANFNSDVFVLKVDPDTLDIVD